MRDGDARARPLGRSWIILMIEMKYAVRNKHQSRPAVVEGHLPGLGGALRAFKSKAQYLVGVWGLAPPQVLEPPWRQLGVAHGRLDASVTEVRLQRAGIGPLVCQRVAAG